MKRIERCRGNIEILKNNVLSCFAICFQEHFIQSLVSTTWSLILSSSLVLSSSCHGTAFNCFVIFSFLYELIKFPLQRCRLYNFPCFLLATLFLYLLFCNDAVQIYCVIIRNRYCNLTSLLKQYTHAALVISFCDIINLV